MLSDAQEKFNELRRRAEVLIGSPLGGQEVLSEAIRLLQELVQEFEVYQAELEMQNEELRRSEQRLQASENKFAELYDFAPVGYFTFDRKGTILEVNLTGAGLLGLERQRLIGKPFAAYCTPDSADSFYLHQLRVIKSGHPESCELTLKRPDGTPFETQLESVATEDERGVFNLCRSALIDVSERKDRKSVV
jgi:PAS domain S-box-containing protein